MKKLFVVLSVSVFLFLSQSIASATLMNVGNNLVYDDTLNKVWYSDLTAFYGTYDQTMAMTGTLDKTITINGQAMNLNWRGASIDEAKTIDFLDSSTRSLFTPISTGTQTFGPGNLVSSNLFGIPFDWYRYSARAGIGTYGEPDPLYGIMIWLRRAIWVSVDDPSIAYLNASDSMLREMLVSPNDLNYQWILADVAPVPEPSTLLLLGAGLGGFALYKRKTKKKV